MSSLEAGQLPPSLNEQKVEWSASYCCLGSQPDEQCLPLLPGGALTGNQTLPTCWPFFPPVSLTLFSPLLPQPTCLFLLHGSLSFPSMCFLLLLPLSLLSSPQPFLPCLLQSLSRPAVPHQPTLPCQPIFLSSLLLPQPSHVPTSPFHLSSAPPGSPFHLPVRLQGLLPCEAR